MKSLMILLSSLFLMLLLAVPITAKDLTPTYSDELVTVDQAKTTSVAQPAQPKALIELIEETELTKAAFIEHLKPQLDAAYATDLVIEAADKVLGPAVGDILEAYVELPVHATISHEWHLLFYGFRYFPTIIPYHNNVEFTFNHDKVVYDVRVVSVEFPTEEGARIKAPNIGLLGNKARFNLEIERMRASTASHLNIPTDLSWQTTFFQINSPILQYFLLNWSYNASKTYAINVQRSPLITTTNTTLYQKQTYNPKDNYVRGFDIHNKPLHWDSKTMTISGTINTSKPGKYRQVLTYHYLYQGVPKEYTKVYFVDIIADQTAVLLQDVSLYQGQAYNANAPFLNVTNKDGEPLKAENIHYYYVNNQLTKEIDTSVPGKHDVRIVIQDATNAWRYSETARVTVKPDQTTAVLKDIELYQGQSFDANAPFDTVTNKDGTPLKAEGINYYYINNVLTKELDTTQPGSHQVRIVIQDATSKWVYSDPKTITIKKDYTAIEAKNTSYYVGETYEAIKGFVSATDEDNRALAFAAEMSWMNDQKPVDMSRAGTYQVYYGLTNMSGQLVIKAVEVKVKERDLILTVAPSQAFGNVNLGETMTNLYWKKENKVAVSDEGDKGWQLQAALVNATQFERYLFIRDQSFADGAVLISDGRGSQVVSDQLATVDFVYVNYQATTQLRTDSGVIEWMLSPSIRAVTE